MGETVDVEKFYVRNTSSYNKTANADYPWDIGKFRENIEIRVVKYNGVDMEFDLIGINTVFVNAFRRCLLAEVPSMAIEKVHLYNNTSVLQDEVLAHRLGLIPLKADPRKFKFMPKDAKDFSEDDTLEFDIKVKYTKKPITYPDASEWTNTDKVLTKYMRWVPRGNQASLFQPEDVGPVDDKIVIAKLALGSEIEAKLFASKGIGSDNAKFQPVGTAFYRFLPRITLLREFTGEEAHKLQSCFSPGVIKIAKNDETGEEVAYVADARYDSGSRNVYRYPDFKNYVKTESIPNHTIFTVESIGALPPDVLFLEAIKVLDKKCTQLLKELKRENTMGMV